MFLGGHANPTSIRITHMTKYDKKKHSNFLLFLALVSAGTSPTPEDEKAAPKQGCLFDYKRFEFLRPIPSPLRCTRSSGANT